MAKILTIRPPEELQEGIKRMAREQGFTVNSLVIQILWNWIKLREESADKQK